MTRRAGQPLLSRIWRRLRGTRQSPRRVALAVALGLFIGCLPVYGLHFLLCSLLCVPFGLDLLLCYLVANISNPLVAPFLITLEIDVGSLVTTGRHAAFTLARARQTGILGFVLQASVGSVFVGSALAALGSAIAYGVARRRRALLVTEAEDVDAHVEAALLRTVERYRGAPIADRIYVAAKLRSDPLTRLLAGLSGDFGRVLDVGAGRGQFGLFLLELGCATHVHGFDSDARKVAVARGAAARAAEFQVRDALDLPAHDVDTLLLVDVLHYLPLGTQNELVRRAAHCARSRVLIRELDAAPAARSAVTRALEWLAQISGYNRGGAGRHYRPASELRALLELEGFTCQVLGASQGTPFGNVLIIATRVPVRPAPV